MSPLSISTFGLISDSINARPSTISKASLGFLVIMRDVSIPRPGNVRGSDELDRKDLLNKNNNLAIILSNRIFF